RVRSHTTRSAGAARLWSHRGFSMVETTVVAALSITAAAAVLPVTLNTISSFRANCDAHPIVNHLAVAKMRAAANFTWSRLYIDLNSNSYRIEVWRKTGAPGWITEGGTLNLAQGNTFSFGALTIPPPGTQATLAQAPPCQDDAGNVIGNTACVLFNSRRIPIVSFGARP